MQTLAAFQATGDGKATPRLKMSAWGTVELVEGWLPLFGRGDPAKTPQENALAAVARIRPLLALTASDALELINVTKTHDGHRAVFRQRHEGLRVAGALVLGFDGSGTLVSLENHCLPSIRQSAFATSALATSARDSAVSALRKSHPNATDIVTSLRYVPSTDACDPGDLVYHLDYRMEKRPWRRTVRAKTGMTLRDESRSWAVGNTQVRRENCI
ncbi:MAG: hypothetical protein KAI47_05420, partial [Deltaproteobacteria bacterium]|nr:hypothetical protein [Deltaproteobacteria bacterium]